MIRIISLLVFLAVLLFSSCKTEPQKPAKVDITPSDVQPTVSAIDSDSNAVITNALVPAPSSRLISPVAEKKWDLRTEMTRAKFYETQGAELEMMLIRPIYSKIYDMDENDSEVIMELTEGQKALYFFRKMDEAMSEGGIESLYQSELPQYLPTISQSFQDINIPELGSMAEKAAIEHKRMNSLASPDAIQEKDPYMNKFDSEFSKGHDGFYKKLEGYIREHPEEFVQFVD